MTDWPTTRYSLILNLVDETDRLAWQEFVKLYEPVIYRFARRRGVQHDDAIEVIQRVLVSVHKSVKGWSTEQKPDHFRKWLATVAANALINFVKREHPKRAAGGSSNFARLQNLRDAKAADDDDLWLAEEQRVMMRIAANRIQAEFQTESWTAFSRTLIDGESVEQVAQSLGKSEIAIYAARARIVRRLRTEVNRLLEAQE